jgi:hypothetical protein
MVDSKAENGLIEWIRIVRPMRGESVSSVVPRLNPFPVAGSKGFDAIPPEGVTGCGTNGIEDHQFINTRQAFFLKRKSSL